MKKVLKNKKLLNNFYYSTSSDNKYINHLKNETSPYLLQVTSFFLFILYPDLIFVKHANNPVNWYPWNKESLELSKKLDRPIFLSIGYSTW